jgi:ribosomal protein S5
MTETRGLRRVYRTRKRGQVTMAGAVRGTGLIAGACPRAA